MFCASQKYIKYKKKIIPASQLRQNIFPKLFYIICKKKNYLCKPIIILYIQANYYLKINISKKIYILYHINLY